MVGLRIISAVGQPTWAVMEELFGVSIAQIVKIPHDDAGKQSRATEIAA
jgi:hypothetical protein